MENGTRRDRRTRAQRAAAYRSADETYQHYRPSYPPPILDAALDAVPSSSQRVLRVVEVGAGTGLFTSGLLKRSRERHRPIDLTAIEPAQAMAEQLRCREPGVCVRQASGEDTGLPDQCADVVVYAQSWHWVDAPRAAAEATRLIVAGGALVLVWNQLDVSVPWVHRLTRIMRSGDVLALDRPTDLHLHFTCVARARTTFVQRLVPRDVMALARTRSSYLAAPPHRRVHMQENLEWYLGEHLGYDANDAVPLPYLSVAWTYRTTKRR
ncbi:MAG: class I SAM-dependent methyltransferase [Bowdeniella nasicola]|nr:class I SAM-dependent methyltransferase [Bowdeniella nasicola]